MIKMLMVNEAKGDKLLVLGLEKRNIELLVDEGVRMEFKCADVGLPKLAVMIVYGESQQDVIDELKALGIRVPVDKAPVLKPGDLPVIIRNPDWKGGS